MKTLLIYPNDPFQFSLPHSIGKVSAALKELGDEVRLFDTTMYKSPNKTEEEKRIDRGEVNFFEDYGLKETDMFEDFNKEIGKFKPNRLMITFVDNTIDLGMKLLKSNSKSIKTIAGGVSVILGPERFDNSLIDVAWKGSVESLLFPNNSDIELMDDWTIFDPKRFYRPWGGKYLKTIPVSTDNGCPYSCGFCAAPALRDKMKYKKKSLGNVIRELEFQVRTHNPEFIYFSSETFFSKSSKYLKKFAEAYKYVGLPFWCQTHVNTITEEKVGLLKDMGCYEIAMGIECGNEQYRKEMLGKNFTNNKAIESVRLLNKYNIQTVVNNMVGLPMETEAQMKDTIKLNRKLYNEMPNIHMNCFIYQPYHGTRLREFCKENNLLGDKKSNTLLGKPVIKNPFVSDKKIMEYRDNFFNIVTEKTKI